jgi:lauroyl/myristoyl acyltransferase
MSERRSPLTLPRWPAIVDGVAGALTDTGYALGWRTVRALPGPVAARLFQAGADLAVRRDGRAVRQLRRNLARVLGTGSSPAQLERAVAEAMRGYAR